MAANRKTSGAQHPQKPISQEPAPTAENLKPMDSAAENTSDTKLNSLIQDLEFKTLTLEISENKLREEVESRKKYEREITKLNHSLQEQALRLHELNRELKSFAYTVSHDLKAPLRGILGYSNELLKRHSDSLTERPLFCVTQIASAAQSLENLIEDLLEYSRLELEIPTSIEINIRDLLDKLLIARSSVIRENRTLLLLDIGQERITGWERGFQQALANLIDNAIKYSRNQIEPEVKVTVYKSGACFRIEVADNGIGFDMQFSDRIFNLFHRLSTPVPFEGTGAGLAIVKKVIDKMEGKVWAESEPGKGATFIIEIPDRNEVLAP
jgi:signal transduction histidine kinase